MSQILVQESKYEKYARALENTKYEQCFGLLADGNKRCAVGVLLSECFGWDGTMNGDNIADSDLLIAFRNAVPSGMMTAIWALNDGWASARRHDHSFKEIAQWLREQK